METRVKEIIERAGGIKSFRFEGDMDYKAGQFFFVTLEGDKTKHFSFSSSPTEKGFVEFTKKLSDSDYSQALKRLKPGDDAVVENPSGEFVMGGEKKIAFLTGGIGITPFRSMLKYISDTGSDKDVVLLYSSRDSDIPFKEDLDEFSGRENIKVVYTLTGDDESWSGRRGRIDEAMVKEEVPDYKERVFYTAGPPKMVEAMTGVVGGLGVKGFKKENFPGY